MQPKVDQFFKGNLVMAWNIVRHAFVIVFGNFAEALKASIAPFAILVITVLVLNTALGLPLYQDALIAPDAGMQGAIAMASIITIPLYLFIFGWVAVTWHRFILLEEYPTAVPAVAGRPIGAYVGRTVMMTLQMTLIMVPIILVSVLIVGDIFTEPNAFLMNTGTGIAFAIGFGTAFTFFWFRVGISLPAVAVGEPINSRKAWAETKPVWQTILGASIIMVSLNIVVTLLFSLLFVGIPLVAYVLSIAIQWATMMVGVSVLTTIYGHVIEGRPLSGA
jgi:hypothetical protein